MFLMAWVVAAVLVIMDQASKTIAHRLVAPGGSLRILPFLDIVNWQNPGSAFGMFQHAGSVFFIVITAAVIVAIIYAMARGGARHFGLVLVLAGAAGNLADRLMLGSVRDFIYFHAGRFYWPAFNFADSYITIGVILLFFASTKKAGR